MVFNFILRRCIFVLLAIGCVGLPVRETSADDDGKISFNAMVYDMGNRLKI